MGYCYICDCHVRSSNWYKHNNGRRHLENSGTSSVHFNKIYYTQCSVARVFRDGTTLEEGVENVLAGYSYPIEVYDMGNGDYAARNNRTLFCYELAGFRWFPVVVVGRWYGRNTFSEAPRVRGESSF
ncbi:Hypothetical protein, putative [Bodo saltans]|uniref:Uncharacterized protein n=1 Tax=Bodo saltans TaxID=75058 RepID=A0A0S4IVB9_BODSA|nr:Hypothetical protein, putative [Bodo saltans]|eukprot:CUG03435.1 Hypothetical protein, putative [Bodo saltans]